MELKNLEQVLKMHQDLTTQLDRQAEILRSGKAPTMSALIKDKEQRAAAAKMELELAIKEHDEAVNQWEERVKRRKEKLSQLKEELTALKAMVEKQESPSKTNTKEKLPKGAPK